MCRILEPKSGDARNVSPGLKKASSCIDKEMRYHFRRDRADHNTEDCVVSSHVPTAEAQPTGRIVGVIAVKDVLQRLPLVAKAVS